MNDQVWGVLGIEATNDERAIRKAYLARLPEVHPEEDPQGFKALREAYETALDMAQQGCAQDHSEVSPEVNTPEEDPALIEARGWMDNLVQIERDPALRFLEEPYEQLIQQLGTLSLSALYTLTQPTLNWAMDHRYLPNRVLRHLRDRLEWSALLPQYPADQALYLEDFLVGLDAEDVFDLSTLKRWPTPLQEATLRFLTMLAGEYGRGNLAAVEMLLNEPGVFLLPECPRAAMLVLRCYTAVEQPVSEEWLHYAQRLLKHLFDQQPEDRCWLLAQLHSHRGDYLNAMSALRPLVTVDASPEIKSFIVELHQRFRPEWVPLWVMLLKPGLQQPLDAAECMVMTTSRRALARSEGLLQDSITRLIDSVLECSSPYECPDPFFFESHEPNSLASLYEWLKQLLAGPRVFHCQEVNPEHLKAAIPGLELPMQLAVEILLEHQCLQEQSWAELGRVVDQAGKGSLQAVSRSMLWRVISYCPDAPLETLQRLVEGAGIEVGEPELVRIPADIIEWVKDRIGLGSQHWFEKASFPDSAERVDDCIRLGLLLDCKPDRLLDPGARGLLERILAHPEDTPFKLLADLVLNIGNGGGESFVLNTFCQRHVNTLDNSGLGRSFARLLRTPGIIRYVMQHWPGDHRLPDASWVPLLAALLGDSSENSIDNLLFLFLVTFDDAMAESMPEPLTGRPMPRMERIKMPSGVRLAEALTMRPEALKPINEWSADYPEYVAASVELLALLNRRSPQEWPEFLSMSRLYRVYKGEGREKQMVDRLLSGLLLRSVEKRLEHLRDAIKPERHTAFIPFWFGGLLSRRDFALHLMIFLGVVFTWWANLSSLSFEVSLFTMGALTLGVISSLARRMRDAGFGSPRIVLGIALSIVFPFVGLFVLGIMLIKPSAAQLDDHPFNQDTSLTEMLGQYRASLDA